MKQSRRVSLSPNALEILRTRYLARNPSGDLLETPAQMLRRVAENVARADRAYAPGEPVRKTAEKFFNSMLNLEFLPNSPTLMNAGRPLQQLSACFVLPVSDSLESIFEAVKQTALIHRSGGGTGFSFSRLRPKDDPVLSTGGIASGPVSFMRVFNAATEAVRQGGTRRGANMGVLRVDHPDILEFIEVKQDPAELTNFNLSVGVTDRFMEAVQKKEPFQLIHPRTGLPLRRINAGAVFDRIVRSAWATGEPGILFLDRINRNNPTPDLGRMEATNPCGEQPLLPFESCNLGSVNLKLMVCKKGNRTVLDDTRLRRTVRTAVHFLDNVIDANRYPLKETREITLGNRKIGLGVMGFADFLILLGIPYNSEKGVKMAGRVMSIVQKESRLASEELARVRGVFPNFAKSVFSKKGPRLRNATLTTIAPTGTLSLIAGCSSGIEPIYGLITERIVMEKLTLKEIHPLFQQALREEGGMEGLSKKELEEIISGGSVRGSSRVPKRIRDLFPTAHDISPGFHVKIQAAFQKHTDNAVSKTVNFPNNALPGDVKKVFRLAYRKGCKGITIFRSGSRENQILHCIQSLYC